MKMKITKVKNDYTVIITSYTIKECSYNLQGTENQNLNLAASRKKWLIIPGTDSLTV